MIRILGAGVSGLTAAVALARDGHRVELIDESFAIPSVGTALGLFPPAQRVLEQIGALEPVRRRAAMPREGHLLSVGGQVLATVPAGGGLLVSRSDLVSILHDALPASVRCRRERISDVRPLREDAELLIGADGTHSLVRRSGWPGTAARSHHVTVLRGTAEIPPPQVSETWGRGWLFGITPLPGDRTNWFACVPEHRTGSRTADLAHLRAVVGGAHPAIGAVLEAARPGTTLVHGIHTAPPVRPVRQNVVLLGDAAHAMAPNLGHGANTALVDAATLAAALRGAGGGASATGRALRRYALARTVPGQLWRLGSEAMLRLAMMERHAARRDRLIGAVSATVR
ncbi:MAG TPA: FAD-dependent monooxygenase [Actinomycetaceae bacterium]|nr:FAD-dependent monooxygenase [Actinomycetaceae bacterium]